MVARYCRDVAGRCCQCSVSAVCCWMFVPVHGLCIRVGPLFHCFLVMKVQTCWREYGYGYHCYLTNDQWCMLPSCTIVVIYYNNYLACMPMPTISEYRQYILIKTTKSYKVTNLLLAIALVLTAIIHLYMAKPSKGTPVRLSYGLDLLLNACHGMCQSGDVVLQTAGESCHWVTHTFTQVHPGSVSL